MGKRRVLPLLLAAVTLWLTVFPAAAAEPAQSATAATMQLMKTEGTVNVTNSSGRGLTKRDNMNLYNGYHVETKAKSYAWINLDSSKLVKLDAVSEAEVRKSGKTLELLLSSGGFFFNVTSPLKEGETLNVRTATMVVGIRGTSGWFKAVDRWSTEIYVLEGTVQCSVSDPVTGQAKEATIQSGEMAVATAYPQDREGDKCDIVQERFEPGDIDGFVLEELAKDPELCADILEKSGLDVLNAVEATQERREQDEQKMQETLDRIEGQLAEQDSGVSAGTVWDREDAAPGTPDSGGSDNSGSSGGGSSDDNSGSGDDNSGGGGDSSSSGGDNSSSGGDSGGVPGIPPTEPPPADTPTVPSPDSVELKMSEGVTADDVQGELNRDDVNEVILSVGDSQSDSGSQNENTLIINIVDMRIPRGKTLTISEGIGVTIRPGASLMVYGAMIGENSKLTIEAEEKGMVGGLIVKQSTADSSGALTMKTIVNNGTLINEENGTIKAEKLTTNGTFGSEGIINSTIDQTGETADITGGEINGSVTVSDGGTFNMNDGTIDGSVTVSDGGTFNMNDGTIDGDVTVSDGGTFNMNGGTIDGSVTVSDGGTFNMNDGTINGSVTVSGNGIFNENGGETTQSNDP